MPHPAPRGGSAARDESDHRFLASALGLIDEELCGVLFRRTADLADHYDGFGLSVGEEEFEPLDEVHAFHGVAADPERRRLSEAFTGGLKHRLIGERARARHDPDFAGFEDVAGHDSDLARACGHYAGTVRADKARLGAGERTLHLHHVGDRNALGDADDQRNFGINRLGDGIRGAGWRHVDHACVAAGFFLRLHHGVEHRQAEMRLPPFARRRAADHFRAVVDRGLRMEGAVLAGETLADELSVSVDQDGHQAEPFTAFTIFCAASSRSSAEVTLRFDCAMIFLPFSTLVPSSRTTSGTRRPTSFTAATTPSAMMSHFMMPPKIFTRMPFTLGSDVMILNAAVTFSVVAEPPTSRKFAGAIP